MSISPPLAVDVPFIATREPAVKRKKRIRNDAVDSDTVKVEQGIESDGVDADKVQQGGDASESRSPARSPIVEYETSLEVSVLRQQTLHVERRGSSESDFPRDYVATLRYDES